MRLVQKKSKIMEQATKTTVTKETTTSGAEVHEHQEATTTEVKTDRTEQTEQPEHKRVTTTTTTTVEND